ncbi:hypothetical protein [Haladaptatus sp. DFWS20]|uniref:hypothetical protein n=1 Tax=Haladaptatus sp. DFWS20 TaxID=3403467 RepID=UPI003EBDE1E8
MPADTSNHDDEDWGAQMDTIERKLNQGSQHRRSILAAFANADESELNTSILRERADVPTGSANHHLVTMEEWGLIEDTGEREYPAGGGRPARIWRLTEFAEEFIETTDTALSPPPTAETAARVAAIENRLETVENQLDDQEKIKKALVLLASKSDAVSDENVAEMRDLLDVN